MIAPIPNTTSTPVRMPPRERLQLTAFFASTVTHIPRQHLIAFAANPKEVIPDINIRIISAMEINRRGNLSEEEVYELFELVQNEDLFPIEDPELGENHAFLRVEAALTLARHGLEILDSNELLESFTEQVNEIQTALSKRNRTDFQNNLLRNLKQVLSLIREYKIPTQGILIYQI